jgi:hypothetical protein
MAVKAARPALFGPSMRASAMRLSQSLGMPDALLSFERVVGVGAGCEVD